MNPLAITYLNRLSDLLFILARHANREPGDVLWVRAASAEGLPRTGYRTGLRSQFVPGGPASSHDWNPVSDAGLIASSTLPAVVLQATTTCSA